MEKVNVKINGKDYAVTKGATVLEACRALGIEIPTLCYLKDINEIGACRMCVVEIKGVRGYAAACVYPIERDGTEIVTNSPAIVHDRKMTLELLLSTHKRNCLSCIRSGNCEFQKLCHEYGIETETRFEGEKNEYAVDDTALHMFRDDGKCVLCRRCVAACNTVQSVSVIGVNERGFQTHIGSAFEADLNDVACVSCGQCINVCPTGALSEKDETDKVLAALNDPEKHVVVQTAPSIRVAIGEEFGMPIGTIATGKLVAALKMLGFDGVFDTNFTADVTILEEANEFLERFKKQEKLPLITSCSPGWIKFAEHFYPDMLDNLSSCKSPQGIFGALAKTYYAEKIGVAPENIYVVSIMPCTAKKFEASRHDHTAVPGLPDIDVVLTTRELARLIKRQGILFADLEDAEYDAPFGMGSGAGTIFGATGGVMEAALRTAAEVVTGKPLDALEFHEVRGTKGIKEATYELAGNTIRVAVASGLSNARTLLDQVKSGEKEYDFIEIMACPGGCVNGGGQPIHSGAYRNFNDIRDIRAKALYQDDQNLPIRKSHENTDVQHLYDEFLGQPGSHKAHALLHTAYTVRPLY